MTDQYTRIRARAGSVIKKFGGPISFYALEDPITPLFSGFAVQAAGDPDTLDPDSAKLNNPIIVKVAAQDLDGTPVPRMLFKWTDGVYYTIAKAQGVNPGGNAPIYFNVMGST